MVILCYTRFSSSVFFLISKITVYVLQIKQYIKCCIGKLYIVYLGTSKLDYEKI